MKVILLGYMASGKSAVGAYLSKLLDYQFIDLDNFIEEQEDLSVSEIFNQKGEIYFRKKEHQYLKEVLNSEGNFVLSLGGGTPCYAGNMSVIKGFDKTISIYLKASVEELVDRLINEKDKRPLVSRLNSREALTEFIGKHLFERKEFYNQANLILNTNSKTIDDIAKQIVIQLYQ